MGFLHLNGIEIPIRDKEAGRKPVEVGDRTRAFDGTLRVSRQRIKQEYAFETTPVTAGEAAALEGLIQGDGHRWGFEAGWPTMVYSSKGLGPSEISVSPDGIWADESGRWPGSLSLRSSLNGARVKWQTLLGSEWTVAFWRSIDEGTSWSHYVIRSDGAKWINGIRADGTPTPFLLVDAIGDVTLSDVFHVNGMMIYWDDLLAVSYLVPEPWVLSLAQTSSSPQSDLPHLRATGDAIKGTPVVVGQVTDVSFVQAYVNGVFQNNMHVLSFVLSEV